MSQQLIDEKTRKALTKKFLAELRDDVQLSVFVGKENPEYCDFSVQLCKELNQIDKRIQYTVYDSSEKIHIPDVNIASRPTILIGWKEGYHIKYTGAPAGHEASGFIETISLVSRGQSGLQQASLEKLDKIDRETVIQVFVTPSCPYCPQAVLLANQIAIAAKGKVTAECVEASQNMILAQKFNVSSVPQQVINEDMNSVSIGVQQEPSFVDSVLQYGSSRYQEILAAEKEKARKAEKLVDVPTNPVVLTDNNFDQAVAKYPALVVDCWAEWCAPCRMVAPVIEKLAGHYAGKVMFGKLDVDHNKKISQRYGIMSIPTLLFFKEGGMAGNKVGALPEQMLEGALREFKLV